MSASGSPWASEKDGLLRSMGAAGEMRRRARLLKIKLARSPPGLKAKGK